MDADARTRTRGRTRGEKALIEGVVRASLLVLDRDAREEEEEEEEEEENEGANIRTCHFTTETSSKRRNSGSTNTKRKP